MIRYLVFLLLLVGSANAQFFQSPSLASIPSDEALDRAKQDNALTSSSVPFHAVLEVAPTADDNPEFHARIELFWRNAQAYRLILHSPAFDQTLVVNAAVVDETDRGDYYPNWLHGFVMALLDPMPRAQELRGLNQTIAVDPRSSFSCVRRDDRPGGITDQLTWAQVCFSGAAPRLEFAMDFTYNMEFHDFAKFHELEIARTYITGTKDHDRLTGTLSTLEDWNPQSTFLAVTNPTPPQSRILTTFVSTLKEESMVESTPKDIVWPTVREGKLEGYMIVHAITDRTGQVRETSKHNSDNPGLEEFGREVALKYKFKPLIMDGVARQMEMPLVLHFITKLANPIPELDDSATRKIITGCDLPKKIDDPASAGQQIFIQFQVQTDGHLMTLGSSDRKIPVMTLYQRFRGCHFGQFTQNGVPTAYHANLAVKAK